MDKPEIKVVRLGGPIRVSGDVKLTDNDGNVIETPAKYTICGCGKSQKGVFCDGSHKQ